MIVIERFEELNVSRETFSLLERYCQEVMLWGGKINLLALKDSKSLSMLLERHVLDSARLLPHIVGTMVDVGSGAGFPGVVLSLCGIEKVTLVEPNGKKAAFLNHVRGKLCGRWSVFADTIENYSAHQVETITSRAFADCLHLISSCQNLINDKTQFLLLKSRTQWEDEVKNLSVKYKFDLQVIADQDTNRGVLLKFTGLTLL